MLEHDGIGKEIEMALWALNLDFPGGLVETLLSMAGVYGASKLLARSKINVRRKKMWLPPQ